MRMTLRQHKVIRNYSSTDMHKMAQKFHMRKNEPKIPVESLRRPTLRCSSPEDETAVLVSNFSICDQTKKFVTNHDSGGSVESGRGGSNQQITGSDISREGLKTNSGQVATRLPPVCSVALKLSTSEERLEAMNGPINLHSSAASEKYSLSLFQRPKCHYCGLLGSGRCTKCKQIYYCSVECQRKDWQKHGLICKPVELNSVKVEDNAKPSSEVKKKEGVQFVDQNRTEQNRVTMFSDLTTLGLKEKMKIQGTVTEFLNPKEFYVQVNSSEVLSNISKLTEKLKYCKGVNDEYIPVKGEVSIAEYSVDKTWYRVLIKEVDIHKKNAQVLYIDYGNGENVPLNKIKRLDKDIAHFPPCAIKCSLSNALTAKIGWSANIQNTVGPILIGKSCSLTIIKILMAEMPYFAVDVTLLNSGKRLHEIILGMEHELKSEDRKNKDYPSTGPILEKISIQEKRTENEDCSDCLTPNIISLPIGEVFLGSVGYIETPGDFFCLQTANSCKLSALHVALCEYCEKVSAVPDFCPTEGDVCCAQFTEDKLWYRASVLSYVSEKTVLVGYVDYGNVEVLQLSKLRPIIPELIELPFQAIKCRLAGVKPTSAAWSTEATSIMKKLLQNKVVTIKVMDKKDNTLAVEIIDESVTPVINVSKYLLKSGFAVEESFTTLSVVKPNTSVGKMNGEKLWQTDWPWVKLKAQQVVDVMVHAVNNPSDFYCQLLTGNDLYALKDLNISLAEYCKKEAPGISKITKGEVCCAYFSGDGKWYRALVVDVTAADCFKVQFVDYGNCEKITLDKVRQISPAFMKLPFQAIRCSLSGVRPANKEWTSEAIATLQMCTAGKKLQANIVTVSTDRTEIELIDISTSSPIIINHILINEHLALKSEILSNQITLASGLKTTDFQDSPERATCSCTELREKVAQLERIVYFLLKDRFGEDKIPEIVNSFER